MIKFLLASVIAMFAGYADAGSVAGHVEWQAVGTPGFLKINADGGEFVGRVTQDDKGRVTGEFTCALALFKTGFALRDEHMRDRYLEVAKFPEAKLVLDAWSPSPNKTAWSGNLTLKGVTKPVSGTANYSEGKVHAEFVVNVSDYPISVPSYLGVTMAKEVTVSVEGSVQ